MSRNTSDQSAMSDLAFGTLAAVLVVVAVIASMAITGMMAWSDEARKAFRDEVLTVLDQRFHVPAKTVPDDLDTIEIRGQRRDLRRLFDHATAQEEPERREEIYRWFLDDPATGHFVVRAQPFPPESKDQPQKPPLSGIQRLAPKLVKPLRIGPDGEIK